MWLGLIRNLVIPQLIHYYPQKQFYLTQIIFNLRNHKIIIFINKESFTY